MVDPNNITNYHRTKEELEEFWLFCIMAAGKNSQYVSKVLDKLLKYTEKPFVFLKNLTERERLILLKSVKIGQYNRINNAIRDSLLLNLRTCNVSDLEQVYGVGPKTARFFLLHTRGEEHAVLDTHILKWLRNKGYEAPNNTPQNRNTYKKLEEIFKKEVAKDGEYATLAEADLEIWKHYAAK